MFSQIVCVVAIFLLHDRWFEREELHLNALRARYSM